MNLLPTTTYHRAPVVLWRNIANKRREMHLWNSSWDSMSPIEQCKDKFCSCNHYRLFPRHILWFLKKRSNENWERLMHLPSLLPWRFITNHSHPTRDANRFIALTATLITTLETRAGSWTATFRDIVCTSPVSLVVDIIMATTVPRQYIMSVHILLSQRSKLPCPTFQKANVSKFTPCWMNNKLLKPMRLVHHQVC